MADDSALTSALTLADWSDLDPAERDRRRAGAVARAGASAHGDWIGPVRDGSPGEGPLAGVPFSVKDNVDVRGVPTTAGSPLLDDSPAAVDATVVSALRAAGAVVVGKTNLHELAFGITSNNKAFGPVRNPADPDRSAGGSSGGSAVGVALGVVPFALGTDTGGSVTVPASFCGVVGFRPSTGRYPGDGVVNLSTSRDTIGVHARVVRDVRTVDRVITGEPDAPPVTLAGLRIGLPRSRFRHLDPEVAAAVDEVLSTLEQAGAHLVEVDLGDDVQVAAGAGNDLVFFEAPRLLARRVRSAVERWPERVVSPDVRALVGLMASAPVTADAYEDARAARWRLRRAYAEVFARVDVVLGPTAPVLPPLLGEDEVITHNGQQVPVFPTVTRNVGPGTVAGLPMLSLPAGRSRTGLPVGVCLEAHPFGDTRLLRVAEAVQDALREVVAPR
ncbi:amidase family protein [Actinosynnema sp. NPDC047251]|uniref:Putative indoleacetamide hydrolase n=1 Tax=Saccharothrix espanaensis (strain ATCC 51144 / DSM 44229 / JCM 9112 / NBRC 15066 / NRRL 15764) TaxID=1179773 RepID=K0K2X6_SACES|nr:amidase family protein [Saccharothrix espanaensis]CCH31224.1 putative indoleacetamide hydrolase [Saccharothrix espanaensis DSM 44229]